MGASRRGPRYLGIRTGVAHTCLFRRPACEEWPRASHADQSSRQLPMGQNEFRCGSGTSFPRDREICAVSKLQGRSPGKIIALGKRAAACEEALWGMHPHCGLVSTMCAGWLCTGTWSNVRRRSNVIPLFGSQLHCEDSYLRAGSRHVCQHWRRDGGSQRAAPVSSPATRVTPSTQGATCSASRRGWA